MGRATATLMLGFLVSCATPSIPETDAPGDVPPGRRPPPSAAHSTDRSLLADRAVEALERWDRDRWERFVDASDPGELAVDLRVAQESIDGGDWTLAQLFLNGDELFEHDFGSGEGFGPGRSRVHFADVGGPDALSCAECHHRGGFDGGGDRTQNAFFDGDGADPSSAFERNPPHTLGLGLVERLAQEMTEHLQIAKHEAVLGARSSGRHQSRSLWAKGISFGEITARPDGTLDVSKVAGVDPDLVVRPFGWKGSTADLRSFVIDGFQRHHGVQLPHPKSKGAGPDWDRDRDGVPYEISEGMITSVVAYLSLLDVPVMLPPRDPALLRRHEEGMHLFESIGCASCHVPSLPLIDPVVRLTKVHDVDLLREGEDPRPRKDVFDGSSGIPIFLFSDLKRHAMGPALSEGRPTVQGIPGDVFLTRPLWGLADTGPYLHDGRAVTLDDAIVAHDGEARESRQRFERLSKEDKGSLRVFLRSLSRYPRIEYR